MKLAYIHGSPVRAGAANAIHVVRMCAAFARQGAQVVLVSPAGDDAIRLDRFQDYFGRNACGFELQEVRSPRRASSVVSPVLAARMCRSIGPDIVYTRSVLAAAATTVCRLPTIFEAHALVRQSGRLAVAAMRVAERTHYLRSVVFISEALRQATLQDHPRLRGRTTVAPDGADPGVIQPQLDAPSPAKERLKVGYVGQLYAGKGMEIIAPLAERCPEHEFHVVGGPSDLASGWAAKVQLGNIRFHGPVAPGTVPERLRSFDVLIAPYQRSVRGRNGRVDIAAWMSPLKLFEYMAAGRPMIASDLPVLREVLRHGENALLCPPDDVEAWARALQALAIDSALRERLQSNAYRDLERKYSWDQRARKLIELCRSVTFP